MQKKVFMFDSKQIRILGFFFKPHHHGIDNFALQSASICSLLFSFHLLAGVIQTINCIVVYESMLILLTFLTLYKFLEDRD